MAVQSYTWALRRGQPWALLHHARVAAQRQLLRAGDRLFAADDQVAREHGLQASVLRGGLRRSYRDPRFDRLGAGGAP